MRLKSLPIYSLILLAIAFANARETGASSEWNLQIAPLVRYIGVDGDEKKFREDWWMRQGWVGGLEEFTFSRTLREDVSLTWEAELIVPHEDYRVMLEVDREGSGFIRAGYREYRKYFDDSGGFFAPFSIPSFSLDRDLHLDIGSIYVEAGISFLEPFSILLGYERKFKEGGKSVLTWGSVTEGDVTRKIFPAFKEIDETVDIYRVDLGLEIGRFRLRDLLRYERTSIDTNRVEQEGNLDTGSSQRVIVSEGTRHHSFRNTSHLESYLHEKIYLSSFLHSKEMPLSGCRRCRSVRGPLTGIGLPAPWMWNENLIY